MEPTVAPTATMEPTEEPEEAGPLTGAEAPPTADFPTWGTVSNTGNQVLNCRVDPSTDALIIGNFPQGSIVDVTGETNADGWIPVACGDQDGWVFENYLTLGEPGEPKPETATVVTNGQNAACLGEADASSDVVWSVANGTVVTVTGDASGDYTPVLCGDQEGWIATTLHCTTAR